MTEMRYDSVQVKAKVTPEGYILDTPVLTRTGVFEYKMPDGSIRKEYRPKSSMLNEDSLKLYKGLPITWKHKSYVNNSNIKRQLIGAVLSEGRQDGANLVADVVIHDTECIESGDTELSLGYQLRLDESPGVTEDGEPYDAIQYDIKPNHLAVVNRGRVGTARFNLDSIDEHIAKDQQMEQKLKEMEAKLGEVTASNAELQSRLDSADEMVKQMKARLDEAEEAAQKAKAIASVQVGCERIGVTFNEDNAKGSMRAAINKVFGEGVLNLDAEGLDLHSVFDTALGVHAARGEAAAWNASQAKEINEDSAPSSMSAAEARRKYILGE